MSNKVSFPSVFKKKLANCLKSWCKGLELLQAAVALPGFKRTCVCRRSFAKSSGQVITWKLLWLHSWLRNWQIEENANLGLMADFSHSRHIHSLKLQMPVSMPGSMLMQQLQQKLMMPMSKLGAGSSAQGNAMLAVVCRINGPKGKSVANGDLQSNWAAEHMNKKGSMRILIRQLASESRKLARWLHVHENLLLMMVIKIVSKPNSQPHTWYFICIYVWKTQKTPTQMVLVFVLTEELLHQH